MDSQASQLTLGLLPEPRTRWGRFVLSYGVQSVVVAFFVIVGIMYPDVLESRCTTTTSSAWSALRLRFRRLRRRSSIFPFHSEDHRTGNAAARSHARPRRIGPAEKASSRGPGAQSNSGCHQRTFAGREADDPSAAGQDECVLHGKLGDANHGSRAAESADRWLRRPQRRAGIGESRPSDYDRAGGLFRYALRPRLWQRYRRVAWRARSGGEHWFWQRCG